MTSRSILLAGAGAIVLGLATLPTADAAVLSNVSNLALSATPVTISLNGGGATFAFTSMPLTGNGPGAWVATTGTARVSTFFGKVSDFSGSAMIDGTGLYSFAAYPTPSLIPNSPADDFIGFSFTQSDGTHYGYAEVAGPSLVGYGYQTTASATILTGAIGGMAPAPIVGGGGTGGGGTGGGGTGGGGTGGGGTGGGGTGGGGTGGGGTGGGGGMTATPEPTTMALLLSGLATLTVVRRRKV